MTYQAHPLRIRLSRKKGYRKPAGAVVVSRPSKWGNPFNCSDDPYLNVASFREWLEGARYRTRFDLTDQRAAILRDLESLRGKQLACWCPLDKRCHADVLAEIANR